MIELAPYWRTVAQVVDRNRDHPWTAEVASAQEMAARFARIRYHFIPVRDVWGTAHVWDLWEVDRKGYAACADAAAAIAAAALELGRPAWLCFKLSRDGSDAHLTATVDGIEFDPYAAAWPRELAAPGCTGGLELLP